MGMLVNGNWRAEAGRTIVDGAFQRETSRIDNKITCSTVRDIETGQGRHFLLASLSCPWSHRALLVRAVKSLHDLLPLHIAGEPRIEGYGMLPDGPLTLGGLVPRHVHQLYSATDAKYTGRVTVPLLWDSADSRILSNDSAKIMRALDLATTSPFSLVPPHLEADIDTLNNTIHAGLANGVYRAGLAQLQTAYDAAVRDVFQTLDQLETRLAQKRFIFGQILTESDLRLFATLVRFDAVYATHFRCTRKRLVDYSNLWAYARDIYAWPRVADTVDFDANLAGYYLNDGDNPHGIIAEMPEADWDEPADREHLGDPCVWLRRGEAVPAVHISALEQLR